MYSIDRAYLEYFKCAAEGKYDRHFISDRVTVITVAACTLGATLLRLFGRTIYLIVEVVRVVFYAFLTLVTFGTQGNFERLKAHLQLLPLNLLCMAAHSSQLVVHFLSMAVGIISPSIAFRMMQASSSSLAWLRSNEDKIRRHYRTSETFAKISDSLKLRVTKMFVNSSWVVKCVMRTFINEFSHAFDSSLVSPLGHMEKFHLFGANPLVLTESQKKMTPILLLNGNYSHQATFLPMLYRLSRSGNKRPVYTINLPPNTRDIQLILDKIEAIKIQYNKQDSLFFKLDMIGHSMGAEVIQLLLKSKFSNFANRVITIGTPCHIQSLFNHDKVFDITAKNDLLILEKSRLNNPQNIVEIDTGHLGLLFDKNSLRAVEEFLEA